MQFLDPPASRAPDALPVLHSSLEHLNLAAVRRHIAAAVARGRSEAFPEILDYLEQRRCIVIYGGTVFVTLTGLLCFGVAPQTCCPQAVVDLGHYHGADVCAEAVIRLEKNIGGTIFQQIDYIETYLWDHIRHEHGSNAASKKSIALDEYPREVIHEITVNMLAHRDYIAHPSSARVLLLKDRIEWISPGGIMDGLTPHNLLSAKQFRNPNLMHILYEAGQVDALGQGLDTTVAIMQAEHMLPIEFVDMQNAFLVRVKSRLEAVGARRRNALQHLTNPQRRILEILEAREELSSQELHLLTTRSKRAVQRDLRVLAEVGLIRIFGSPHTLRYRINEARE